MAYLKINNMTQPPPDNSFYSLIEILIVCATFITVCWKWTDEYFKSKKDNNQKFIESVVEATMTSCLKDFKTEFHEFRTNTEKQMNKFNDTVTNIYKDMPKN